MGLRGEAIRHQPVKDRLVVQEAPADELHAVRCQDKLLEVFVGQKAEITGLPLLEPDGLGLKVKEGQIAAADGAAAATAAPGIHVQGLEVLGPDREMPGQVATA